MMRPFSVLALSALAGCGDGIHRATPVDCDPLAGTGCPEGTHCRVLAAGATACLAPEAPSRTCTPASCAPGEACAEVEGRTACHPLCDLEGPGCANGTVCAYGLADDRPWGLCPVPCTLGGCGPDATCAPTTATPYPLCVAVGPGEPGSDCSAERCGPGLACLVRDDQPSCTRLCDPRAPAACPGRCTGHIEGLEGLRFCDDG